MARVPAAVIARAIKLQWQLAPLIFACSDTRTTMMYYWIVKRDGYEARDLMSYRETLCALRAHHIIVESLSPLLSDASFALDHQIKTEETWRDLNDALVTYLQSQHVQDDKEQPVIGVYLGTIAAFKNPATKI